MKSMAAQKKKAKMKVFPLSVFIITFVVFGLFTTLQMNIIGEYIDYKKLPPSLVAAVLLCWLVAAVTFTLLTRYQITARYEKPMMRFAEATQKVAAGDFSVYVPARHTSYKTDYLDVIFADFNKMVAELGSIETLKTDFISNVSHEIKTPLAVIQNTAELLKNDSLTPQQRQAYILSINEASKRLSSLITNILKLNKLEGQTIKPQSEPFDLCEQLCGCALAFEDIWEQKNIEFEAQLEDRLTLFSDAPLLELVWNNLLSNAFKFTNEGGRVTLRQWSDSNNAFIAVSDDGCGMSEETRRHIFDKFYQGDTSHSAQGNGLGLALAVRVLQLVDGSLEAESELGKGSTFTVKLPIKM